MALDKEEIKAQRALMEQLIEKKEAELKEAKDDFIDAFGETNVVERPHNIRNLFLAVVIGIMGGVAILIAVKKYYPAFYPFT